MQNKKTKSALLVLTRLDIFMLNLIFIEILYSQGLNIPNPIQNFNEGNFPPFITSVLQKLGHSIPTTIQAQGWPIALSGKNLVGIAQTGSGKTLAVNI